MIYVIVGRIGVILVGVLGFFMFVGLFRIVVSRWGGDVRRVLGWTR